MKKYYTSEAVTEGHPDKICDKIADKILDEALKIDKESKMAVEATIKDDLVVIYGEVKTKANLDYEKIAKWVIKDIGYNEEYNVLVKVSNQSEEITNKVEQEVTCAGDQGIMFGYACSDTKELMPLPIMLANKLAYELTNLRKSGECDFLLPDGKTQVTICYEDDKPMYIDRVIISTQHKKEINLNDLEQILKEKLIEKVLPKKLINDFTKISINPSGTFILGGSFGDSGTTGRKIVVDTYGGICPVGGGCFSSKDPSKVDRSAAYYARYVAKNIVAKKLADKCLISLAYVIGYKEPVSVEIETYQTEHVSLNEIKEYVNNNFNFSVQNIINELNLKEQNYYNLAAYGHFGRNTTWEKIKD